MGKRDDRRHKDRSLTYSFPCAVLAIPSVAEYGVGELPAESDVKIPQFDLTPFEFLPGSIVSPTSTSRPEGQVENGHAGSVIPQSRELNTPEPQQAWA